MDAGAWLWARLVYLLWTLPVTAVVTVYTAAVNGFLLWLRLWGGSDRAFRGDRNQHTALDVSFALLWGVLTAALILALGSVYIWVIVIGIVVLLALYSLVWLYRYQANHTWRELLRGEGLWR